MPVDALVSNVELRPVPSNTSKGVAAQKSNAHPDRSCSRQVSSSTSINPPDRSEAFRQRLVYVGICFGDLAGAAAGNLTRTGLRQVRDVVEYVAAPAFQQKRLAVGRQ